MLRKRLTPAVLLLAFCWLALGSKTAPAYDERFEKVELRDSWFTMTYGDYRKVEVPEGWRHVREIFVTSEGYGYNNGEVEVWANGELKGTMRGAKLDHRIVIGETVKHIEFRHVRGDGIRINSVKAVLSVRCVDELRYDEEGRRFRGRSEFPSTNIASWLANRAIDLVDRLRKYADPETEYVAYLLPVKTVAGRTKGIALAKGDLAADTREALHLLARQLKFAEPVISSMMKRDVTFDLAVELVAVKNEIQDRLR